MKQFKIRCSQIGKIMGEMGITDSQHKEIFELENRNGKPRTEKQENKYIELIKKRDNPELPTGCQTYLKDWYAEQMYGQREEIRSKYFDKGNYCEREAIDVCAERLGFGILDKNEQHFENEYLTGTPDVVDSIIIDTKCPWDGKTFLDSVISPIDKDYEAQLNGYMALTGLKDAKLCYVLLDIPAECNYDNEVVYSAIPLEHRFFVQDVKFNPNFIANVYARVEKCRTWLSEYDILVKSQLK